MRQADARAGACSKCGLEFPDSQSICPHCGALKIPEYAHGPERTAALGEALTFQASRTLDRLKPLEPPIALDRLQPAADDDPAFMFNKEPLPWTIQPYRFGKFYSVVQVVIGVGFVIAGIAEGNDAGWIFTIILGVLGVVQTVIGIGLYRKMRFALIALYISCGLGALGVIARVLSGDFAGLLSLVILAPITYYFMKRSDEFD